MKSMQNKLGRIPAALILIVVTFLDLGLDIAFAGIRHCGEENRNNPPRGAVSSVLAISATPQESHSNSQEHECIGCCHHVLTETIFDATPFLTLTLASLQNNLPAILYSDTPAFHPPRD
jgi:hypothetical protein